MKEGGFNREREGKRWSEVERDSEVHRERER